MAWITSVLLDSTVELLYLVGVPIGIGLLLGAMERMANRNMQLALGRFGIIITAWLGTPIHELGHALMCILFRHKIEEIKLLQLGESDGTLGYVRNSYNKNNLYQRVGNLFIGMGPLFSGSIVLISSMFFLLPNSFKLFQASVTNGVPLSGNATQTVLWVSGASKQLIFSIFSKANLSHADFWVFIVIAICISSHIAMSSADIKGVVDGLLVSFSALFVVNIVSNLYGLHVMKYLAVVSRYNIYVLSVLSVAIIFSLVTLAVSAVIRRLR